MLGFFFGYQRAQSTSTRYLYSLYLVVTRILLLRQILISRCHCCDPNANVSRVAAIFEKRGDQVIKAVYIFEPCIHSCIHSTLQCPVGDLVLVSILYVSALPISL